MEKVVLLRPTPTIQYGFLILSQFRSGTFAALEDTCYHSKQECIDAAHAYWNGRGSDQVLNIFSIDTETGKMDVLYDYCDCDSLFREMEDDQKTDDQRAFEKKEQAVIDSYNQRHDATL